MINIPAAASSYPACVDGQAYELLPQFRGLSQNVVFTACVRVCKVGRRGGATLPTRRSGQAAYPIGLVWTF